ncbi:MAG TPA: MTH1187 family thiamine-binding protein [Rubrobacteraceae bacterium]|nr:MTH1187 family thiamine-binding protein [Rubrobacteraceae bacterium]
MIIAEVGIIPIGTETPSVSRYIAAAVKELEVSGLKCSLSALGTTVEAESAEQFYAALGRAQEAVFGLGIGRVYTIVKMDERRDVEGRSGDDMVRSARQQAGESE